MPIAAVAAVVTPEMAPNKAAKPSDVIGMCARKPPISDSTHFSSRTEMPPRDIRSPANTKNGTASSGNLFRLLKTICGTTVIGTSKKHKRMISEVTSNSRKIGKPSRSSTKGRIPITQYMAIAPP